MPSNLNMSGPIKRSHLSLVWDCAGITMHQSINIKDHPASLDNNNSFSFLEEGIGWLMFSLNTAVA